MKYITRGIHRGDASYQPVLKRYSIPIPVTGTDKTLYTILLRRGYYINTPSRILDEVLQG
jgi:hypothetical protein